MWILKAKLKEDADFYGKEIHRIYADLARNPWDAALVSEKVCFCEKMQALCLEELQELERIEKEEKEKIRRERNKRMSILRKFAGVTP